MIQLPSLKLEDLCSDSPIIIKDNRIYFVEPDTSTVQTSRRVVDSRTGHEIPASIVRYILGRYSSSTRVRLTESETLRNYEALYYAENERQIKALISQLISESHSALRREQQSAEQDLFALRERFKVVEFIISKVFPYYFNRSRPTPKRRIKSIVNKSKTPSGAYLKNSPRLLSILKAADQKDGDPYQRLTKSESLLETILRGPQPIYVTGNDIYRIMTTRPAISTRTINIGGVQYFLEPYSNITVIGNQFQKSLIKRLQALAIEDESLITWKKEFDKRKGLAEIVKSDNYRKRDIGFFVHDGAYYVSMRIPEFALQGFDGNFYAFNSCTVAVELITDNGVIVGWTMPVVWETYSHPFLPSLNSARQGICLSASLDSEKMKQWIIEQCRLFDKGQTKIEHQIEVALYEGRRAILQGYSAKNESDFIPHKPLEIGKFTEERTRYLSNPAFYRKKVTNKVG